MVLMGSQIQRYLYTLIILLFFIVTWKRANQPRRNDNDNDNDNENHNDNDNKNGNDNDSVITIA